MFFGSYKKWKEYWLLSEAFAIKISGNRSAGGNEYLDEYYSTIVKVLPVNLLKCIPAIHGIGIWALIKVKRYEELQWLKLQLSSLII